MSYLNEEANKNAFQHCVAPKAFVNQANFKAFVNQANFKTFAWITGKKLKSQVNQSNLKKSHEPPVVNNWHNCPQTSKTDFFEFSFRFV